MIYKKDAVFPYPVLSNNSSAFKNNEMSVVLKDVAKIGENYSFEIEFFFGSPFIERLVKNEQVSIYFIMQTRDNYFQKIAYNQKYVELPAKRIDLSKLSHLQLQLISNVEINYSDCNDFTSFYHQYREKLTVDAHRLIGYSNVINLEGEDSKPHELFEYRTDKKMNSDFKIELTNDVIVLVFKDEKYNLQAMRQNSALHNMYLYQGLSRVLMQFYNTYLPDQEDILYVNEDLTIDNDNILDYKLLNLMLNKQVKYLSFENLDEVIHSLASNIIKKFVENLERITQNES